MKRWKSAMCRSAPSSPSHQIMRSARFGLSDHSLSSRNSWPMNSIGTPGAVRSSPVATRARLRAYHDRGLFTVGEPGDPRLAWSVAVEHEVVVLDAVVGLPGVSVVPGPLQPAAEGAEVDRRVCSPGRLGEDSAHGVAAGRRRTRGRSPCPSPVAAGPRATPARVPPVLGDQRRRRLAVAQRRGQVLAERPARRCASITVTSSNRNPSTWYSSRNITAFSIRNDRTPGSLKAKTLPPAQSAPEKYRLLLPVRAAGRSK